MDGEWAMRHAQWGTAAAKENGIADLQSSNVAASCSAAEPRRHTLMPAPHSKGERTYCTATVRSSVSPSESCLQVCTFELTVDFLLLILGGLGIGSRP